MLLIPTNQFSKVRDNNQQWLNTITYATMMLWQPESNEGNVTYRLGTTNMTDIYNIVFIAQKLWKLTAKSRKNESKTGYDCRKNPYSTWSTLTYLTIVKHV